MNVSSIKVSYGTEKVKSSKKDWKLTDTLREQVIEYAKEDAKKNVYMGEKFKCLRKSEVAKVAPDRMALIATINQATSFGDMGDMQKIKGSGERWLYVLFGIPYEAEFQSVGFGSAIHVYDENGDEILTYTGGVGWQEKESKAETMVHKSLRLTYYNAWQDAKKEIKKEIKQNSKQLVSAGGEIVWQSSFDLKS